MARSALTRSQLGKFAAGAGIEGIEEIKRNLADVLDRMTHGEVKDVLLEAGGVAVQEIRKNIHSESGLLEDAVFVSEGKPDKPDVIIGVSYGARGRAPHAWLVEFGHRLIRGAQIIGQVVAHPYFRPGIATARPKMAAIIARGLARIVAGKKGAA